MELFNKCYTEILHFAVGSFRLNSKINVVLCLHIFLLLNESTLSQYQARGGVVVKVLHYKPAGRGFDSRCSHWNFSVT